jgi:hypothetical protein
MPGDDAPPRYALVYETPGTGHVGAVCHFASSSRS